MKRVHIFVTGKVQGVFFRHHTMQTASALDIKGWVRNLRDGRVEILCEGNDQNIDQLLAWCKQGPPRSSVKKVDISWEEYKGEFYNFEILY